MESVILTLGDRIQYNESWLQATTQLARKSVRDGLDVSLDAFNKTSIYFAYEEAPTERGLEVSL